VRAIYQALATCLSQLKSFCCWFQMQIESLQKLTEERLWTEIEILGGFNLLSGNNYFSPVATLKLL
jgi:hypothetical protein